MKVSLEQIREITRGTAWIEEKDGLVHFHRFTAEQEAIYESVREGLYIKSKGSAGVQMVFRTDSRKLGLAVQTACSSTRKFFSVDVLVNGVLVGQLENYLDIPWPDVREKHYSEIDYPLGDFAGTFDLGSGEKTVTLCFPWSVITGLRELTLDDGATVQPVKAARKGIIFGDSITHGYDTRVSSQSYASMLALALDADARNKGIGAEVFFPPLARAKDEGFDPDFITVAYGTNDWSLKTQDEFRKNCRDFYAALSENYPNAKIFAITPTWRADYQDDRTFGDFMLVEQYIRELTEDLPNVICIRGFEMVPQDVELFGDRYLHPNEAGFEHYFRNLYKAITPLL